MSRLLFTCFLFLGVLVSIIMLSPGVESQLYKVSVREGLGRRTDRPTLYTQSKGLTFQVLMVCAGGRVGGHLNLLQGGSQRRILVITTALCRQVPGVRLPSSAEA